MAAAALTAAPVPPAQQQPHSPAVAQLDAFLALADKPVKEVRQALFDLLEA